MIRTMEMPSDAYRCLLKCLRCAEEVLLPAQGPVGEAAEQYLAARDYWIARGWAELEIGGALRLTREAARALYSLSHPRAALRWDRAEGTEWLVRGPVECMHIREADGLVSLNLVQNAFPREYLREAALRRPEGEMCAWRASDGERLRVAPSGGNLPEGESPDALAKLLFLLCEDEGEIDA